VCNFRQFLFNNRHIFRIECLLLLTHQMKAIHNSEKVVKQW
jgi:hypothetical protein